MRVTTYLAAMGLAGCASKAWVHPEHPGEQAAKDEYSCMKENTFEASSAAADRGGVRGRRGMEVNPTLFRACMEARGYRRERTGVAGGPMGRVPDHGPIVLSAAGHVATGFEVDARQELGEALETVRRTVGVTTRSAHFGATLGVAVQTGPLVDVGVSLGVRSTEANVELDCANLGSCGRLRVTARSGVGALDLRGRLPWLPRLAGIVGVGLQAWPTLPAIVVPLENAIGTADVARIDATLLPSARLGLHVDLAHAEPHGLAWALGTEVLLRDASREGSAADRPFVLWTGLSYRLSIGRSGRGPAPPG